MPEIFDTLFSQFKGYTPFFLILELTAIFFGLLSVTYSAKNNILVYPTGLISTFIFVYILYTANLYGDLIINAYYFYMSLYGWILWSRKDNQNHDLLKISKVSVKDNKICLAIFIVSVIFVSVVYHFFNMFNQWWAYVDTFITGLFFIGMWLLAKRKIENWLYLIAGDIIAIPLFFYKGLIFTGFFYIVLTIIAIFGYQSWKETLQSKQLLQ
ncbi:nicotinamide riboside transporter PnuC [Flavobacterium sp. NRK1]|uniref:nicotinamide riboside transporter PnuC n=1 Tax=Flavobacterium sp. NRK1 TaxID=2954929 RepID=UPI0020929B2D|nr:nicotinamide riboside transporter PnuC [Flavobacterium sp. NRK1]MCO6147212.1 nicotinamide riboside transporter PnuC [Flavobacterium sp. NRK1]